jgi:hypothetical protein
MTIAMQWFGKHASTIETVFSVWSMTRSYLEDNRRYKAEFRVRLWSVSQWAMEAEESPLLRSLPGNV